MVPVQGLLDRLPAWLRHALIVFGGSFLGAIGKAILAAQGVTGVHWVATLTAALNLAVVAVVVSSGLLSLTPLTRQYGVGAGPAA